MCLRSVVPIQLKSDFKNCSIYFELRTNAYEKRVMKFVTSTSSNLTQSQNVLNVAFEWTELAKRVPDMYDKLCKVFFTGIVFQAKIHVTVFGIKLFNYLHSPTSCRFAE